MSEKDDVIALANKVLDTPNRDPDDDLSSMSRQFLRSLEREAALLSALEEAQAVRAPIDTAIADLETAIPGVFWHIAKGRLTEQEPLFAAVVMFGPEDLGHAEGHDAADVIRQATAVAVGALTPSGSK